MENKLLQALLSHYKAEQEKAEADLLIYFKGPTGIGEHGNVVDEMIKHVDRVAAARDGLQVVESLIQPPDGQSTDNEVSLPK